MGILDWLLGRTPPKRPTATTSQKRSTPPVITPVAAPKGLAVTINRPGGIVETKVVEPDGTTFDDWVADMEKKESPAARQPRIQKVSVDERALSILDIRGVDSIRVRIVGSAYCLTHKERDTFGGAEYLLKPEPENKHDPHAIAVYGRGRKVGYVSSAKASALSGILATMPFDAFRIAGASTTESSSRMWADLPRLPALRTFAKGHPAP
ncbi:HIRAN domain-containing protein [Mycetocola zhadangensis]|uniref:HIRAN domain-containing protein n=1 Tax=Mycetocola zhadangensis TaxID=1164595 RepID=A0A3L7J586_9MICO|nr:HIRAN domain-containing protein [Mycetocola zhadangensis]RLQ85866.1 hypothetical protein D9V28_03145 [Mycetocola zhadangensis]GGE86520.1 hypothetical protein GCM10011313_06180 [Mycetocola zhadangensis]